jgi:hypothetical protein
MRLIESIKTHERDHFQSVEHAFRQHALTVRRRG